MLQTVLYASVRLMLRFYAGLMLKMDIHHKGLLPAGPKIFVPNHPSATDPFMIHLVSREQMNVLITETAFSVPVFGWFLQKVREIPVPLENGGVSLDHACRTLQEGRSVVIFTEGQISPPDGSFWPPRTGAARLALRTGVPVIPVGIFLRRELGTTIRSKIAGSHTEGYWYLRGPYAMTIGQPMQFCGDCEDRQYVRQVTETIMHQIRLLAHESEQRTKRLNLAVSSM